MSMAAAMKLTIETRIANITLLHLQQQDLSSLSIEELTKKYLEVQSKVEEQVYKTMDANPADSTDS